MAHSKSSGHSLVELVAAISIFLIIAALAAPSFTARFDSQKLDAAAGELVNALKYARSEAIRTGTPHEVFLSPDNKIYVYRLKLSAPTVVRDNLSLHPLNKKGYEIDLFGADKTAGVIFSNNGPSFEFDSITKQDSVYFSTRGLPFFKLADGHYHRLTSAALSVSFKGAEKQLSLDRLTGKASLI